MAQKMSTYQAFIKSQVKLGKTFKQAVKLWKKAKWEQKMKKSGNLGKARARGKKLAKLAKRKRNKKAAIARARGRNLKKMRRQKTRVIVRKKIVVRRVKSKPRVIVRKIRAKPRRTISRSVTRIVREAPSVSNMQLTELIEKMPKGASVEETAIKIVDLYFREIARHGIKREMDLDAVINAYKYALSKLKSQ